MSHLDLFFEAIDLTVLNGWGLTETSPVLCCRLSDAHQNVRGTVGYLIPDTEIRIVDPDSTRDVPDGTPGTTDPSFVSHMHISAIQVLDRP